MCVLERLMVESLIIVDHLSDQHDEGSQNPVRLVVGNRGDFYC